MAYGSEAWQSQYQGNMSAARADEPSNGAYTYQTGRDHYYGDLSHDSAYYMSPTDRSNAWSTSSQADTPRADTIGSPPGSSAYMDYQQNEFYQAQNNENLVCHCGKTFRRTSDLTKHSKYHVKNFACLIVGCDRVFSTSKDLTRHYRSIHRTGEGFRCQVKGCRKAASGHLYSRKDNYDRHVRTAHPADWASQNGLL